MHPGAVSCLSFTDEQLIVSGSSLGTISLSDLSSDQRVATLETTGSVGPEINSLFGMLIHLLMMLRWLFVLYGYLCCMLAEKQSSMHLWQLPWFRLARTKKIRKKQLVKSDRQLERSCYNLDAVVLISQDILFVGSTKSCPINCIFSFSCSFKVARGLPACLRFIVLSAWSYPPSVALSFAFQPNSPSRTRC